MQSLPSMESSLSAPTSALFRDLNNPVEFGDQRQQNCARLSQLGRFEEVSLRLSRPSLHRRRRKLSDTFRGGRGRRRSLTGMSGAIEGPIRAPLDLGMCEIEYRYPRPSARIGLCACAGPFQTPLRARQLYWGWSTFAPTVLKNQH